MRLNTAIINGIGWTTFANVGGQLLGLATTMVLARLLVPADFGLVAMVLVFTHFATMLADFGLASAIVQKKEISNLQLSTLFWLNMIFGAALFALGIVGARAVAWFYEEPGLVHITYGLSVCFLLSALGVVPAALMRKQMRFKLYSLLTVAALALSCVAALAAALAGWGVWSLVVQAIVRPFLASGLYLLAGRFKPSAAFSVRAVIPLLRYGIGYTGFNIVNFWAKNIDNLIIGKLLGSQSLGYYTQAYSLMRLPITQVMGSLTGVMFPALSSIQDDKEECKKVYLKTMSFIALATFPISLAMVVMAEPLVFTFLGDQWGQTVILVQILAITGISSTYSNPTGWLYTSQGRTDWMFWWGLFASSALIIGIAIGATIGTIEAIAIGYVVPHLLLSFPAIAIPGRLIGMKASEVFAITRAPLFCAIGMAIVLFFVRAILPEWPAIIEFLVLLIVVCVVYGALLAGFGVKAAREAVAFITTSRKNKVTKE